MILNAFSITELFLSSLSLILWVWAAAGAGVLARRWRRASSPEARQAVEEKSLLLMLVTVIACGLRFFNWPLFYATLQSFVPDIDGAMCIFGVTQVERFFTGLAEALKPVSFFLMGGWLSLHFLDQRTQTSPLMGRKLLFLTLVSALAAAESLADLSVVIGIAPGRMVSCCTTVTDVLERPSRMLPRSILGQGYRSWLEIGYYASNLGLLGLLWIYYRLAGEGGLRFRRLLGGSLCLWALANAALFLLTQIEVHAPRIMGLPFHHCLYCLWQYVPDTVLMYLLFIVGTSAAGWAFLLDLLGRKAETETVLPAYLRRLTGTSLLCLGASLLMNTMHLAVLLGK